MGDDPPPGRLVFVDGRDALATVIVTANEAGDGVVIEAAANGISHQQGAAILRHVADQWDPDHTADAVDWEHG